MAPRGSTAGFDKLDGGLDKLDARVDAQGRHMDVRFDALSRDIVSTRDRLAQIEERIGITSASS